ncbi:hypothetical protein DTW90_37520 [Neorhizobium sp. P12A]|nr:hypothetical protein DTW90_37520 [Neorhizobium sp. P12A]
MALLIMRVLLVFSVVLTFAAVSAHADEVSVRNEGPAAIYKLYAWPDDLLPRSTNLLNMPLSPGETQIVTVDNAWNDCSFMFEVDLNNPSTPARRIKKKLVPIFTVHNICSTAPNVIDLNN